MFSTSVRQTSIETPEARIASFNELSAKVFLAQAILFDIRDGTLNDRNDLQERLKQLGVYQDPNKSITIHAVREEILDYIKALSCKADLRTHANPDSDRILERSSGTPGMSYEALASDLKIATKTLQRWSRYGLIAIDCCMPDKIKKRKYFLAPVIDQFLKRYPALVSNATGFKRVKSDKDAIYCAVKNQIAAGLSSFAARQEVARILKCSPETVRNITRQDRELEISAIQRELQKIYAVKLFFMTGSQSEQEIEEPKSLEPSSVPTMEERSLFKHYNVIKQQASDLRAALPDDISEMSQLEEIKSALLKIKEIRRAIFVRYSGFVRIPTRGTHSSQTSEEIISDRAMALLDAIETFDWQGEDAFDTHLKKQYAIVRVHDWRNEHMQKKIFRPLNESESKVPDNRPLEELEDLRIERSKIIVKELLASVENSTYRDAIVQRLGLLGTAKRTQKELGEFEGHSKALIHQREKRGYDAMKRDFGGLYDFDELDFSDPKSLLFANLFPKGPLLPK